MAGRYIERVMPGKNITATEDDSDDKVASLIVYCDGGLLQC
jgi:hypothetical protein